MTIHTLEPLVEFVVITNTQRMAYKTNTLEAAQRYRDTVNPTWIVVEMTTTYKTI